MEPDDEQEEPELDQQPVYGGHNKIMLTSKSVPIVGCSRPPPAAVQYHRQLGWTQCAVRPYATRPYNNVNSCSYACARPLQYPAMRYSPPPLQFYRHS